MTIKKLLLALSTTVALTSVPTGAIAQDTAACPLVDDPRPELKIAMPSLWPSYDGVANSNFAARVNQSLYDRIVERDWLSAPNGTGAELKPGIAESWARISDNVWEIKIRKGVTFHDGTPLTAEDVAYTISPDRAEINPRVTRYNSVFTDVKVIDEHTVQVTTDGPDAIFAWRLASPLGAVVPKDRYLEEGESFGANPVGTGPYKWVGKRDGEYVQIVANDDYWGEKPPLKCVTFFDVPENSTRIAGLLNGQYDMITSVPLEQKQIIDQAEGFKTQVSVVENQHQMVFTSTEPDHPLYDKRLRQAMEYAIDRQALVDGLWKGLNWVKGLSWREYGELNAFDTTPRPYDPEKAKALIAEAGYNGEPIDIRMVANYYVNLDRAVQVMEEQWKAVGLNVQLTRAENWGQLGNSSAGDYRKYDGIFSSMNLEFIDPVYELVTNWGNKGAYRAAGWNAPDEYYELAKVLSSSFDEEERKQAYEKMYAIWMDETPGINLYRPLEIWGVRNGVNWQNYGMYWQEYTSRTISIDD